MMQVQYSSRFFPTGFRTIRSTNYQGFFAEPRLKDENPNARTQFYPENKPFQKWCLQNILINLYRSLVPKWRSKALAENGVQKRSLSNFIPPNHCEIYIYTYIYIYYIYYQPKQCTIKGEIIQIYHTFVVHVSFLPNG